MQIIVFDPAADLETVHPGHHHVQETNVDPLRPDLLQGLRSINRRDYIIAPGGKHGLQQTEIKRFVVHTQDSRHT
jgi:hypothetical protein